MVRDDIIAALRRALPDLRRRYGLSQIGLYGSVSRDEARPDSDVDLIVAFEPQARVGLRYFELEEELAALLGRPVQLATLERMNSFIRAQAERDLIDVAP